MLSQGDHTGDLCALDNCKHMIKLRDQKPGNVYLGLPHRLDRPTSGILVLAKTSKALTRLNKQFAEKSTQKIYWAMVTGAPKETPTRLQHYLVRKPAQNKSYAHKNEVPNSKMAELIYTKKQEFDRYSLVEIELLTGRHHQIRSQLSAEGLTIKGDLKYGAKRPNNGGSIHLHARKLTLTHPTLKEPVTFTAPPPKDALWNSIPAIETQ